MSPNVSGMGNEFFFFFQFVKYLTKLTKFLLPFDARHVTEIDVCMSVALCYFVKTVKPTIMRFLQQNTSKAVVFCDGKIAQKCEDDHPQQLAERVWGVKLWRFPCLSWLYLSLKRSPSSSSSLHFYSNDIN